MTKTVTIRKLPVRANPVPAEQRRARRRQAMWNTLLEALATIGLGACFILCAVMVLCVA